MKIKLLLLAATLCFSTLKAQDKILIAFPITDYIIERDSVTVVQVKLPVGLSLVEKSMGILRKAFSGTDTSTAMIGNGRCQLIKGSYCYFGMIKANLKQKPTAGNLMYCYVHQPTAYTGSLFDVVKHAVVLQSVEAKVIADVEVLLKLKTKQEETAVLEQLATDVRYTGTEMARQKDMQDIMIGSGKYKGKTIFIAMQAVNTNDVLDFLKYINARPAKYAGNTWKFSEIMATWMDAGAPTVIE